MTENKAAWMEYQNGYPFKVVNAPFPKPGPSQVVVKARAVAINPIDWKIQKYTMYPLPYPSILGEDFAGEIVEVGKGVAKLQVGDRVFGYASDDLTNHNDAKKAFQRYILADTAPMTRIPANITYETAVVLPLGLMSAACALYQPGYLELPWPQVNPVKQKDKVIVVWGGSSSVGVNAIQLAKASGFEVITTCSPHNFELCKSLGANQVLDYRSSTIIEDMLAGLDNKVFRGGVDAVCTTGDVTPEFLKVVGQIKKGNRFIAKVLGREFGEVEMEGVATMMINAQIAADSMVGSKIFHEFLPDAFADKSFTIAPPPQVYHERGLEAIQPALDLLYKGISGKKIVVRL